MKKQLIIPVIILAVLGLGAAGYLAWRGATPEKESPSKNIGGDRDEHGCLIAAGYGFDAEVGACIRAFEMTDDIKRAAKMAVEKAGAGYALTVVSFNSYEEAGAYDIKLERGLERKQETVYIRNWQVTDKPDQSAYPDAQHAIQDILAKKYNKPLSEVNVTVQKEVQGFASGSVLFGRGGPGEGGMWLAVLGNGWQVAWDGNGNVDCSKMRREYGFPDTILVPDFCQAQTSAVEKAVRAYAAAKAGVREDYVTAVSILSKDWSDSCLGLGGIAESCLTVITPGYEVIVKVNGKEQTYRTNSDGSVIRPENN